ncbi:hypothetical protein Tco_0853319 [Tanacetum coccineum]
MGYSFYSPSENKVFVARNAEFFESKLIGTGKQSSRDTPSPRSIVFDTSILRNMSRDLGEPANYRAALLDPESKKWLACDECGKSIHECQRYIRAIRILIALARVLGYEIWQMDVKTAFLYGHLSEEVLYGATSRVL